MKTITITKDLYEFEELSEEAKQKAIDYFIETEEHYFLGEDLTERLYELLKQHKIRETKYGCPGYIEGKKQLHYSLGYRQGDGVCFTGEFKWKNYYVSIAHSGRYYHKHSTRIEICTMFGNNAKDEVYREFKILYNEICDTIESDGYSEIEYNESEENIREMCEANEYFFTIDGKLE